MAMVDAATLALAQRVWDYHTLHHDTAGQRADIILALGSHDLRVAERAAELFHQGCAPLVVMSGGLGHLTQGVFERPEAELFRDAAVAAGVQPEAVLVEPDSSNTGENIVFTRRLLEQRGIPCRSLFLVQKPYMERRSLATLRKRWPEVEVVAVASPQLGLTEYPTKDIPLREVIAIMVGDLQRIKLYPSKGFQIPMDIPPDVWEAFEALVARGFTGHLAAS